MDDDDFENDQLGEGEESSLGEYEGERNDSNQRHGQGRALLPNGDVYEGKYRNGKRHGRGLYVFRGGARYEGQWKKGVKHGEGKFQYPDGSWYEGEWKRDMRHGYGAYHYPNGDVYEGSWRKNLRHGLGNYTYQSSGTKFMGSWVDERMEGRGQLIHPKHRYHGTWGKNLPEGPGVYTFSLKWMQLGQYVHMRVSDQDLAEALDEERAEESTKDPSAIPLGVVALWRATKVGKYDPSLLPAEPVPVTITDSVQSIESVELPEEAGVKEEEAGESQEEPQAPEQAVQDKSPEEAERLASQEIQEGIQPEPEVSAEDYPDTEDEDF